MANFCAVSKSRKNYKVVVGGGGLEWAWGVGWFKSPLNPLVCFFLWNSPLLNGLNPNLSNVADSGKFSKLGEKKYP